VIVNAMAAIAIATQHEGTSYSDPASREGLRSDDLTVSSPLGKASTREADEPLRLPGATDASSTSAVALKSVAVASSQTPPLASARGAQTEGLRAIQAVIGDSVGQNNYIVHCYPPKAASFDIRLPEIVIPHELRSYGRPVYIAIEAQHGSRRPILTPRELTEPLPRLPGQDEVEAWIASFEC
jgi:hypothetical protein